MKSRNFLWFFILFFTSINLQARNYADLEKIVLLSENYLLQKMQQQLAASDYKGAKIHSQALDARLKLPRCDKSLTFEHRIKKTLQGNISVKVICSSPHAWSIYTKHRITVHKKIAIANNSLSKGHIIRESDIIYVSKDISRQRAGYLTDQTLLVGQQLIRPIHEGQAFYQYQLKTPDMIKKGDKVSVVAKIGSLSVITPGIALSDGRLGEQIDVENKRSSRIIQAKITGLNTVEVIL